MPPRPTTRPPPFTHFLCIPLVTPSSRPHLARALAAFRADVTGPSVQSAIPHDAVRPLGTLHLTLGMMSLPDAEGIEKAVSVLRSLKPREILAGIRPLSETTPLAAASTTAKVAAETGGAGAVTVTASETVLETTSSGNNTDNPQLTSLSLTLRGLYSMQQARQAAVLYVPPVDPQGVLLAFCEGLRAPFLEAGVMVAEDRPLLLHATVVNTVYVRNGGRRGRGRRLTVDAREVLDRYDGHVWMEDVPLERIAICRMGAKAVEGEDEAAYELEAEIEF
ncbi:hypothetical protein SODALDRAFT_320123 [Sodiomyces alkalinus F11]|uniref:A-kinase anchor protein 7-like phosphoesterase domain-containing protein n=1 Tax=Sodiomyces alkalinus (strain CBS 110278 / VKM F-3762 / F11) TaxID=1314773 RepID=A0A3N2QAF6_SODAK|nr:hypothetical protein SODALDRAFT_320123 [Sodiomyces alkalinus F11]ROT43730.1 hypothetical protein SODALDRAFT_320123 [Sodiomyces alkalinus F11]